MILLKKIYCCFPNLLSVLAVLAVLFAFQVTTISVSASPIILYQNHHIGISEICTYEAIESSVRVEDEHTSGLSRVLSKEKVGPECEVLGEVVSVAAKTGTTVLGKYPQYIELAGKLNARRFNIPTSVWNKMTPAEQWAANVKFLDRTIARGDNILLANPVKDISKVSGYFRKELDYLIGKGYRLSKDGTQLIR